MRPRLRTSDRTAPTGAIRVAHHTRTSRGAQAHSAGIARSLEDLPEQRLPPAGVARVQVLRTVRYRNDEIHLRQEFDVVACTSIRLLDRPRTIRLHRTVHKEVERHRYITPTKPPRP